MRAYDITAVLLFSCLLNGFSSVRAEAPISANIDCSDIDIDYVDNPDLTRAERIALMEKAFYDSLNKFELCKLSSPSTSSSSSGEQAGTQAGSGTESVASEELQGTESADEPAEAGSMADAQVDEDISGTTNAPSNGRTPEDIPPAANDDAIAAQIRLAAEAETDPEIRKKLWDEYRKYKGMNVEH
jgi:hypothetical protein